MRALTGIAGAAFLAGCVLNPSAEFKRQYETNALGKNFHERTAGGYEPYHPPETTLSGTVIYSLYANSKWRGPLDCVLFYETRDDVIVRAWHQGKNCAISS